MVKGGQEVCRFKMVWKNYKCKWCGHQFKAKANYSASGISEVTGKAKKKSNLSSQIKCTKCGNFIPTWKKEETGNIIGRKHIHIGR